MNDGNAVRSTVQVIRLANNKIIALANDGTLWLGTWNDANFIWDMLPQLPQKNRTTRRQNGRWFHWQP